MSPSSEPLSPSVQAHALSWAYPQRALFSGLSFTLSAGLNLVRGGDGRGKSTLLGLIAGTLLPQAGVLQRQAATLYFQNLADAVHDPVVASDWLAGMQAPFAHWRPDVQAELVAAFGLGEHLHKPLYMLSTGSRRKVGLVAAAASNAELTLIDAPYAALDARSCQALNGVLAQAAHHTHRIWVIADHEVPAALADARWASAVDLGD